MSVRAFSHEGDHQRERSLVHLEQPKRRWCERPFKSGSKLHEKLKIKTGTDPFIFLHSHPVLLRVLPSKAA